MRTNILFLLGSQVIYSFASPMVSLDNATIVGVTDELTNSFYGIPYTQPPYVPRVSILVI